MQNKRDLKEELAFITVLKSLVVSNEEISVIKIQEVRGSVMESRVFASGISEVARDVWAEYKSLLNDILMERNSLQKLINISTTVKKGGWVSVIITPNRKLAGHIVPELVYMFMNEVNRSFSDIVIIGRLGKELYDQSGLKKPYTYFELNDDKVEIGALQPIVDYISKYGKIDAYYGYFNSLGKQQGVKSEITGEKLIFGDNAIQEQNLAVKHADFLFEPAPIEILDSIENQLLSLFFKHAVYESQLAQYGSRIMAMESAMGNIDKRLEDVKYKHKLLIRSKKNKKQQQLLSGMSLWM